MSILLMVVSIMTGTVGLTACFFVIRNNYRTKIGAILSFATVCLGFIALILALILVEWDNVFLAAFDIVIFSVMGILALRKSKERERNSA